MSKRSVNKDKQQEMKSILKIWRDDELSLVYGKQFRKTLTLLDLHKLMSKGNTTAGIARDCRISQENIELCLAYKGSKIFEGALKIMRDSTGRTEAPCSICDQQKFWSIDNQTTATLRCGCRLE